MVGGAFEEKKGVSGPSLLAPGAGTSMGGEKSLPSSQVGRAGGKGGKKRGRSRWSWILFKGIDKGECRATPQFQPFTHISSRPPSHPQVSPTNSMKRADSNTGRRIARQRSRRGKEGGREGGREGRERDVRPEFSL